MDFTLSPTFLRALLDAEHYHHDQKRKGTHVPYISHPLAVCSLVLEMGGTETEAIAALLHDAAEDAGGKPVLRAIETNYGSEVRNIVEECSDALPSKGEAKPPWLERKEKYLAHLRDAGASAMMVSAADKVHNLRAIYSDYRQIHDKIWERFTAPEPKREHILWYYGSLRNAYAASEGPYDSRREPLVQALTELLERLGYDPTFEPALPSRHINGG